MITSNKNNKCYMKKKYTTVLQRAESVSKGTFKVDKAKEFHSLLGRNNSIL